MLVWAILLVGGLGTRLRNVVSDRPEPVTLIERKPLTEYVTRELARHGVTDTVFAVEYKGAIVGEHFSDGTAFEFHAGYAYEETLLGTAGAVESTSRFITEGHLYVLNGDTFYQINYIRLLKQQNSQNLDVTLILCNVPDTSRYGQAVLDRDGSLIGFNEKTEGAGGGTINGGIYLMKQRLLDGMPEGRVSLENDMMPRWLSEGGRLGSFVNDGYFADADIPEAYFQFQKDVKNKVVI